MSFKKQHPYLQKVLKDIPTQHEHFYYFAERYLQHLSTNDVERLTPSDLKTLLSDGWTFLQSWEQPTPKISIQNLAALEHNNERGSVVQLLLTNIPFVADSIITELRRQGHDINFILRGTFKINRENGILKELHDKKTPPNELLLHIELRQQVDKATLEALEATLFSIICDIQLAVDDFDPMKASVNSARDSISLPEHKEEVAFLNWMASDRFIFLGCAEIENSVVSKTLGILNNTKTYSNILKELASSSNSSKKVLRFHKPSYSTKIDRNEPLDILRLRVSEKKEIIFIGILTYAAKSVSSDQIPLLSSKLSALIEHFTSFGEYFNRKELSITLNNLPFVEAVNLNVEEIISICKDIVSHQSKYVFSIRHRFNPALKQLSVMMFMHHKKLTDENRKLITTLLEENIGKSIIHSEVEYIDNDVICLYSIITNAKDPKDSLHDLPEKISIATLSWEDKVRSELISISGLVDGDLLHQKYKLALTPNYKSKHSPQAASKDISILERLSRSQLLLDLELYGEASSEKGLLFHLKIFKQTSPFALFEIFALLDSMGLKLISETSFEINPPSDELCFWIHDLIVETPEAIDFSQITLPFKQLCQKILTKEVTNDELNTLVLKEALNYRQISLLKAFLGYLKQIQFPFGGKYNRDILLRNSKLTNLIIKLFEAKFHPPLSGDERLEFVSSFSKQFEQQLLELKSEDEDKLFRQLYNLVTHIVRTNYFVVGEDESLKPYISFKIASANITDIPKPSPLVEIFTYSKDFEAVHLRSGKVSRGGIRWSDRGEDYRTEVLGLVKAQNTKNSVIIPMGSKGGFYVKTPDPGKEEVIECYKNMMRAMLDITDNIINNQIIHPNLVIRYDEEDPYLVVAADKGTASFSDIANSISDEYNFWLKDAFASGGSDGYDHKKMAITSRGAWESVRQHFKEALDLDPEKDPITAIGVGDMSGDVFGNGLLRSKTIRLKAAFNHKHIFIDPSPDALSSYNERKRLFNLPHSNWSDYSLSLLSKGGMIIDRDVKQITLTPEAKDFLGTASNIERPTDIIKSILKTNIDLLWLGGIGTYIKASSETDEAASDRANDTIRINGQELNAKIVAEGANLGCTHKGRIEYEAVKNGRINADFIDNSGGVDCSDHEVNIKILLNQLVSSNKLSIEKRNDVMRDMTDIVASTVTSENILQNLTLSYSSNHSQKVLDEYLSLMNYLGSHAELDPKIEFLPTELEFKERSKLGKGLTRPELAVLLAYTKNHITSEILKTNIFDLSELNEFLSEYFTNSLDAYKKEILQHPLRKEIIATKITNQIVDRLGIHFIHRLMHQTGKSLVKIINTYLVVKKFFNLEILWAKFDLDLHSLSSQERILQIQAISELVYNASAWLLMFTDAHKDIQTYCSNLEETHAALNESKTDADTPSVCSIPTDSLSKSLKAIIFDLEKKLSTLRINTYTKNLDTKGLELFNKLLPQIRVLLRIDSLEQLLSKVSNNTFWDQLFVLSSQLELSKLHGYLTERICNSILSKKNTLDKITKPYKADIDWLSLMVQQTLNSAKYEPGALTVLMRHLESLTLSILKNLDTQDK